MSQRRAQWLVQETAIEDILTYAYIDDVELWATFKQLAAAADVPEPLAVLRYLKQYEKLPHQLRDRVHA